MVLSKLSDLQADKSLGPDGLHTQDMKSVTNEMTNAFVLILQNSLASENVPFE